MAGEIPPLRIQIEVDTSGFRKVQTDAERMSKSVGESTNKASKSVQNSMNGIKQAASVAAGVIGTAFAVQAIKTFAEVQDSISALEATYGESAESFKRFAAEQAIAYNLSEREALAAQQTFANFARAAGLSGAELENFAIGLTERAADMASYFGGTTAQAIEAMGAALRGETEPIRRYGVLMDDMTLRMKAVEMGIATSTKDALLPQQKVLAANALILQQTAQVQGDVGRTSDSMANQIKNASAQYDNLKTSIGETLSIAAKPLLEFLNTALGAFNKLPQSAQTVSIALAAIGAAALILVPKIMAVRTAFIQMQTAAIAGGRRGGAFFGGMSKKALGAAAALTAVSIAAASTENYWMEGGGHLKDYATDFERAGVAFRAVIDPSIVQRATNFAEGFAAAFLPVKTSLQANKEALTVFDASLADLVTSGNGAEAARQFEHQVGWAERYGASAEDLIALLPQYSAALDATGKSGSDAAGGLDAFASSAQSAEEVASALDEATKNLRGSLDALAGSQMGSEQATMRVEEAYDSALKAYRENSLTLDMTTGKGRDNREALIELATASIQSAEAYAMNGESLDVIQDKMRRSREQFIAVATKMTGSSKKAKELADAYGLVPEKVTTAVEQSGILTAIANQRTLNDELEREIELRAILRGGYTATANYANSGKGDALLNEMTRSSGGSGSRSATKTASAEAAGGNTYYVNAQGLTVDQVAREATRRARLLAPAGGM